MVPVYVNQVITEGVAKVFIICYKVIYAIQSLLKKRNLVHLSHDYLLISMISCICIHIKCVWVLNLRYKIGEMETVYKQFISKTTFFSICFQIEVMKFNAFSIEIFLNKQGNMAKFTIFV